MRFHTLLAVFALLALLVASGCPRNPEGEDAAPPTPAPVTNNTEITIETPDTPPVATASDQETPPAEGDAAADMAAPAEGETAPPADGAAATPTGANPVVVLVTTKGEIEITIHKDWAPLGAEHYLKLVGDKFYDGAPWFRVLPGFVAQCGVAADPAMNDKWAAVKLNDEPVVKGNTPGTVCFGKTGAPNSRGTHVFINLADNTGSLDPQGFACFGEVTKGMDVALALSPAEYQDQMGLGAPGGMDAFKQMFPSADYITKAYVK